MWKAECRCGDWLVVSEDDTYAIAYPETCRGEDAERITHLMAAAPDLLKALISLVEYGTDSEIHNRAIEAINKATKWQHLVMVKN